METQTDSTRLPKSLGLIDLVLFNVVAIVGLRWIPTAAATGTSSIALWILAFFVFFLPTGLAVAELSTRFPQEGGIYVWTKRAFGDLHGFLCGWCYWTTNLVYFPALLIFAAGNAAFIFGERFRYLNENKIYIVSFCLGVLWLAIGLNIIGLSVSKWLSNTGAMGTWIPATALIVLGVWAFWNLGSANTWSYAELLPRFDSLGTLSFWATMCFGFAGLELAPTMGEEIREAKKNIPRAIVISGVLVTVIYILGTAALLVALPRSEISLISGIVESVDHVAGRLGIAQLGALAALLIALGGIGGTNSWIAGSARLPFVAGIDRYLPESFARLHPRYRTPYMAILVQGALSSIFLVVSVAGGNTTVREAYLVLVDMCIITYFIPFLYLFGSLLRLRSLEDRRAGGGLVLVPGGQWGIVVTALLGLGATLISLALALVPAEGVSNKLLFEAKLVGGCLLFIGLGALIPFLKRPK